MEDEENKKLKQKGEKTDGQHVEFRKSRKKGKKRGREKSKRNL